MAIFKTRPVRPRALCRSHRRRQNLLRPRLFPPRFSAGPLWLLSTIGLLLWGSPGSYGQLFEVTTLAGRAATGDDDGRGESARFHSPEGIVVDAAGRAFVADTRNHTIRSITSDGVVTTFAGAAGLPGAADGRGAEARFRYPAGMAIDADGNLFVADRGNHAIRKVTPTGVVSTVAGRPGVAGYVEGPAADARFDSPSVLAVRQDGSLVIGDTVNRVIRVVSPTGQVSLLAGSPGNFGYVNGSGSSVRFGIVYGVVAASDRNVYVTDYLVTGSSRFTSVTTSIRRISPDGTVTAVQQSLPFAPLASSPRGLALDAAGSLIFSDGSLLRKIGRDGAGLTTIARLNTSSALGVAVTPDGNFLVSETGTHSVRRISANGAAVLLAGAAGSSALDGTGPAARFNAPRGLVADEGGNLYVADSGNHSIRRVTSTGEVTTFAGSLQKSGFADGPRQQATFTFPRGLALAADGTLYVADTGTIRKINREGIVSTFAGGDPASPSNLGGLVDGVGRDARFRGPEAIALSPSGDIYVADTGNNVIRKIAPDGRVTTLSDIKPPQAISSPTEIAVDRTGVIYFVDSYGLHKVVDGPQGVEHFMIGTGDPFYRPVGIALAPSGEMFYTAGDEIRLRSLDGSLTKLAGQAYRQGAGITGIEAPGSTLSSDWAPGSADGVGEVAEFSAPRNIAINSRGELFISDTDNNTIRKMFVALNPPRLTNCSVLTSLSDANDSVTLGALLSGAASSLPKLLLLRAAGPALRPFGLLRALSDPKLTCFEGSENVAQNDDWGGTSELSAHFAQAGAFPFSTDSTDAALVRAVTGKSVTVQVAGKTAAGGDVLAEIYDADGPNSEQPPAVRLTNISVLRVIEGELTVGFVVGGTGKKHLLIRAVGPSLEGLFSLRNVLDDPNLEVREAGGRLIARNESWSKAGYSLVILSSFAQVGAFRLQGDSLDAVSLVTVPAGAYTVTVRPGIGRPTGLALLEIYEIP